MTIECIMEDRRSERSSFLSQALHLQLRAVARRFQLDTVVLSDPRGHLWSASSFDGSATGLALMLSGLGALAGPDGLCQVARGEGNVLLKMVQVQDTTLYLASQGRGSNARPALEQAAAGILRIISANN